MKQILLGGLLVLGAVLSVTAVKAALIIFQSREGPGHLVVRWEGAVNDANARDLGASLNSCLGEPLFAEGRVWRAAQWFSGWSCDAVGSPDVMISLNHKPGRDERYYCRTAADTNLIGETLESSTELNDLEFLDTWSDERQRTDACWYLQRSFDALTANQRILVHCDAGRDRTGTASALFAALALERLGRLDARTIDAIECDYRKSDSLTKAKYGRMAMFLGNLQASGGVRAFLTRTCGTSEATLDAAAAKLLGTSIALNPATN